MNAAYEAANRKGFYELIVVPPIPVEGCPASTGPQARGLARQLCELVPGACDRPSHRRNLQVVPPLTELTIGSATPRSCRSPVPGEALRHDPDRPLSPSIARSGTRGVAEAGRDRNEDPVLRFAVPTATAKGTTRPGSARRPSAQKAQAA